jgi:hypothetical protein
MTRRTTRSTKAAPVEGDLKVTPDEGRIENAAPGVKPSDPVNIEVKTPSTDPEPAAPAVAPVKLQNDFREKLSKRPVDENIFAPSNPAALEKAAKQVAQEQGFNLNRGTSIGARLMARAQKRF